VNASPRPCYSDGSVPRGWHGRRSVVASMLPGRRHRAGRGLVAPWRSAATEPSAARSLIPRKVLFGNPDVSWARLTHDGAHLAYVAPLMASGILFLGGGEGGQRGTPAQLPITFRQQAPYRAFCEAAPRVKLELSFRDPHAAVGLYLSLLPSSSTWWRSVSRVRSSFCSRCSRTRRCPSAHEGRRGVVGRAIYAPALILRPRRDPRCHHIVTLRGTSHRCSHRQ
jgi:hypothetical protein